MATKRMADVPIGPGTKWSGVYCYSGTLTNFVRLPVLLNRIPRVLAALRPGGFAIPQLGLRHLRSSRAPFSIIEQVLRLTGIDSFYICVLNTGNDIR